MEEVENKNSITQRELADKLNISVGMTNLFLKRIIKKGYFKVTTLPKRRILYMMTPKGFTEKARLTQEYLQYSLNYYKFIKDKISARLLDLQEKGIRKIAIYGCGEVSELIALLLSGTELILSGIIDMDPAEKMFLGFEIQSPKGYLNGDYECIVVASFESGKTIRDELIRMGYDPEKILLLL